MVKHRGILGGSSGEMRPKVLSFGRSVFEWCSALFDATHRSRYNVRRNLEWLILIGQKQARFGSRNSSSRNSWASVLGVIFAIGFAVTSNAVPSGTPDEIRTRLEPFGSVCRTGDDCGQATAAASSGPMSGQQVYDKFCFACHMSGVGGAPKLDDQVAWTERQAKGMDTLWGSLINGIGAMPAKGTCMGCSDDELRGVLDYMLAGGK